MVAKPVILNSDQGCQFTSNEYMNFLKENQIRQSMDGKSRRADNIMIERWFRSFKYEEAQEWTYNILKLHPEVFSSRFHRILLSDLPDSDNDQSPSQSKALIRSLRLPPKKEQSIFIIRIQMRMKSDNICQTTNSPA